MKVIEILSTWCSCGCCVPEGTGYPGQTEAPADMGLLLLENGEQVESVLVQPGHTMYWHKPVYYPGGPSNPKGQWKPYPEDEEE